MAEIGEIVKAKITKAIDDVVYSLLGEIKGGSSAGEPVYILYHGDLQPMIDKTVLIAVSLPDTKNERRYIGNTANVLTSSLQYYSEELNVSNVILTAEWKSDMSKADLPIPKIEVVWRFYPVGRYPRAILLSYDRHRNIIPHDLLEKHLPEIMKHQPKNENMPGTGRIRSVNSAMRKYLRAVLRQENNIREQYSNPDFVLQRVLLYHESLDYEKQILPEIEDIITSGEFEISKTIPVEIQRKANRN